MPTAARFGPGANCFLGETVDIFRHKFFSVLGLALLLFCLWGCDYGRMKDQESLRAYKAPLPDMPAGTVPTDGGLQLVRSTKLEALKNPLPKTAEIIEQGQTSYEYFCVMCHGANHDGQGTVGQSFSPLPANLKGPYVQNQADGALFKKISLGFQRHPPMAYTVSEEDRWALVSFIRTLNTPK
jgi:mono/diheme cytochrome c family protein